MATYDVFISCKSEDYIYAEEIYDYLKEHGIKAFLASRELRRLGESEYRLAISKALKEAYHIIVFASKAEYIESTWVMYEWDMFLNAKLKGKKQGNILTILKDVSTDDIPMDLWKYESFKLEDFHKNLEKYVETPDSIERKKEIKRKEEEEEKKRKEEEAKARRRAHLKSKLEATADEYKKSVASLQVDADKINSLLKQLGINHRECPICHNSIALKDRFCTTCGWAISPLEGLPELSYLNIDFEDIKQNYTNIFKAYSNMKQSFISISELSLINSRLENELNTQTSKIQELEALVSKQQNLIEELNHKIGNFDTAQEKSNVKLQSHDSESNPACNCQESAEEDFPKEANVSDFQNIEDEPHKISCSIDSKSDYGFSANTPSNIVPEVEMVELYEEKCSEKAVNEEIASTSDTDEPSQIENEDEDVSSDSEPDDASDSNTEEDSSVTETFQPIWNENATADQQMVITEILDNMVKVEGGKLELGATEEQLKWAKNNEKPAHLVELSSFWICKFTVTQREWEAVMDGDASLYRDSKLPKTKISLKDCRAFVEKLIYLTGINFAIPTEAQWEFAARGGVKSKGYIYSGSNELKEVGWYYGSPGSCNTHDVGILNPNELGLFDMSGNVYEWCNDKYANYTSESVKDPNNYYTKVGFWSDGEFVLRGGGYLSGKKYCRVSFRNHSLTNVESSYYGLRIVINQ